LLLASTFLLAGPTVKPGTVFSADQVWYPSLKPVLEPGPPGAWDALGVYGPSGRLQEDTYQLWYVAAGVGTGVGYASSTDGIWYTKYAGNPVLQSGIIGFDDLGILDVSVLLDGGYLSGHYRMWFTGLSQGTGQRAGFDVARIGTADSDWGHPEGPWTKYFAPVLDVGEWLSWDGISVSAPTVLWDERARIYRMWYTGFDGWEYRIGYAVSADGYGWTKYPVPVLSDAFPSLFDAPTVVKIGDFFWMWYHDGKVGYIRCAYSGDGIWWTDWGKPVLKPGIVWDYVSSYVSEPMVFTRDLKTPLWQDSQRLKMFYVADEYGKEKIGYAYTYFGMATLPLFM